MRRLLLLLLLCPLVLLAKPAQDKWHLTVGADVGYDSNVFSLSDSDLDKFDDGNQNLSFIESSDDMILVPSADLSRTFRYGKLRLTPKVKADYRLYTSNDDKSRASALAAVKGEYRHWNATLTAATYPNIYIRNYKDKDGTGTSEKMIYDKNLYKLNVGTRLWKHDYPSFSVKYEVYRYNQYFTEFDGEATTIGFDWKHSFPTFYFTAGYDYRICDCDGSNQGEVSGDESDASYESNIYSFSLDNKKVRIARKKYIRPGISFVFEDRYYQTDKTDLYHANRHDKKYTLTAECDFNIMRHTTWTLQYSRVHRDTDSDYNSGIGTTKDYDDDQVWLRCRYDLTF